MENISPLMLIAAVIGAIGAFLLALGIWLALPGGTWDYCAAAVALTATAALIFHSHRQALSVYGSFLVRTVL